MSNKPLQIVLGVDRLDYTKGVPLKFEAFREALRRYPRLWGRVSLVQHVIPSRTAIPSYQQLRRDVERLVGEINGEFARPGWVPLHYYYHSMPFDTLLAWYRLADVMMVSSLKDGMNLVAKEYCAARCDETGMLLLSEFAGCAEQMGKDAVLFNPFDVAGTAKRLVEALTVDENSRQQKLRRLRRTARRLSLGECVYSGYAGTAPQAA